MYVRTYDSGWSCDSPLLFSLRCSHTTHQLQSQREMLMKKLVEAEMDGSAMTKQVETLKRSLRKMERVS